MTVHALRYAIAALSASSAAAAAAGTAAPSEVVVYTGMCEASGAAMLPAPAAGPPVFLVANDEDNVLRAYALGRSGSGLPVRGGDLNSVLGLDPTDDDDKADLEAAAAMGNRVFWIGSHSRSGKGKFRAQRGKFFATTATVASSGQVGIEAKPEKGVSLTDALVALGAAFSDVTRPDVKEDATLAPEKGGLNIEGLAAQRDGRSMYLGLRSPLGSNGEAWVVPFANPADVVDAGSPPRLGSPISLDLGGRGVRSMEYAPSEDAFYIIAGPARSTGAFDLYRWSGKRSDGTDDKPVPVPGAAAVIAAQPDFQPEAMLVDPASRRIHLFSDDGDRVMQGGKACKKLKDRSEQSFRGITLDLPGP